MLIFVLGSDHWMLLSVNRPREGNIGVTIRYRDSLIAEREACRINATRLLKSFLNEDEAIAPPRWSRWTHHPEAGVCGEACLHWAEEEIRESRGEGLGHKRG